MSHLGRLSATCAIHQQAWRKRHTIANGCPDNLHDRRRLLGAGMLCKQIFVELTSYQALSNTMRRVFLILLIALLPLRGWAVDMMGVVMAAQALSASQHIAGNTSEAGPATSNGAETPFSMSVDCPMWASQTADDDPTVSHSICTTCQLCMALLTGHNFALISTAPLVQAAQGIPGISFSSAEHALRLKPPIS